ncbi:SDR family oxidoreductase [Brevundimonas faecalis]|uniref:NAD(P)-dependent dehydrogenase (Short-subunit alcohol dehydrogenase family) n=1 Tax=Brevundimonas faecalis TaxID=947378 RepID=A0ABV2RBE0_9CAUL
MKTILITGCSSGYGLETARHFHAMGWNVVAAMRTPRDDVLPRSPRIRVVAMDVTRPDSIAAAIDEAGPIDVLVNNAGIGLVGTLEGASLTKAREIFETNTFGVMAVCQAVLPQFRRRGAGTIVNVTSSVAIAAMPLASIYTASKTAVEGFTGSLAHELGAFGLHVRLVQPGYGPTTRFTANSDIRLEEAIHPAYADFAAPIIAAFAAPPLTTAPSDVAEAVWAAVHEPGDHLRFPAGPDAVELALRAG